MCKQLLHEFQQVYDTYSTCYAYAYFADLRRKVTELWNQYPKLFATDYLAREDCLNFYSQLDSHIRYRDTANGIISHTIKCEILQSSSERNVYLHRGTVYKIGCSASETYAEAITWLNFPSSYIAPVYAYGASRDFDWLVMPALGEIRKDCNLYSWIAGRDAEYFHAEDDDYDPHPRYADSPQLILPNGLRIYDAHLHNFCRLLSNYVMVDYAPNSFSDEYLNSRSSRD